MRGARKPLQRAVRAADALGRAFPEARPLAALARLAAAVVEQLPAAPRAPLAVPSQPAPLPVGTVEVLDESGRVIRRVKP